MEPPKLVAQHFTPSLLHPHFQGYTNDTTDPLPVLKQSLPAELECCIAGKGQHSQMHDIIFQKHNYLFRDPWCPGIFYYVDVNLSIRAVRYSVSNKVLEDTITVLQLDSSDRKRGSFYVTMHFVSETEIIICDGTGHVLVAESGDRFERSPWKVLYRERATSNECRLQDARIELVDGKKQFNVMVQSIRKEHKRHVCFLDWLVIDEVLDENNKKVFTLGKKKCIKGPMLPALCAFEAKCRAVILSANKPFWTEGMHLEDEERYPGKVTFGWNQTDKEVILKFVVKPKSRTGHFRVTSQCGLLRVMHRKKKMLHVEMWANVEDMRIKYCVQGELLTVTLIKAKKKQWPSLLRDKKMPPSGFVDVTDPDGFAMTTIDMDVQDYDIPLEEEDYDYYIDRIDATTDRASHRVNITAKNKPSFALVLRPGDTPALGVRRDSDVLLWTFPTASASGDWNPTHVGTLDALSFIERDQTRKKYLMCAPNGLHSVVTEPNDHVYFYRSQHESPQFLEHMVGKRTMLGQMRVHALPRDSPDICGLSVENDVAIVITTKEIIAFQVTA